MFRPQILGDAVFLAKQEEAKQIKGNNHSSAKSISVKTSVPNYGESKTHILTYYGPKNPAKEYKRSNSTLSSKEILECRSKGQCFHYDDPYHPGQECKIKLYALLGEEVDDKKDPEVELIIADMAEQLYNQETLGEISLNALAGHKSSSTLRLQGVIKGRQVSILLDSGSTHSFIDSQMLKTLGLTPWSTHPLLVIVVDGIQVLIDTTCQQVSYTIQGYAFCNDLWPFTLSSADIILGVDWLFKHNPVIFDYKEDKVIFTKDGKKINLKGDTSLATIHTISVKHLAKLLKS